MQRACAMPLVGKRKGKLWLVIHGGTHEVVASYLTLEEQWYHITHKRPAASLAAARRAMRG